MKRLTYDFAVGENHCNQVHGADNLLCEEVCRQYAEKTCEECPIGQAIDRLAHYEDLAEQGRLVVLPESEYTEKDGEEALRRAMYLCSVQNNSITRYTADAIAEKLVRAEAEAAIERMSMED